MHEVAVLLNDDPRLGVAGQLVTIDEIEEHYSTSKAANVNRYRCADGNCGVRVDAVIPAKIKPGRKISPCAYFVARPTHAPGCSRKPNAFQAASQETSGYNAPNSERISSPVIWVDPRKNLSPTSVDSESTDEKSPDQTSDGRSRSRGVKGVSEARSQLVRKFATEWKNMTPNRRRSTPLKAEWNPGGNYDSAINPLINFKKLSLQNRSELLFEATVSRIHEGATGFTLDLVETDSSELQLKIWIRTIALTSGKQGRALKSELEEFKNNPNEISGKKVYFLSSFSTQSSWKNPDWEWLAAPIDHPSLIWISDN